MTGTTQDTGGGGCPMGHDRVPTSDEINPLNAVRSKLSIRKVFM